MKKLLVCGLLSVLGTTLILRAAARPAVAGPQLAHMVFFTLAEDSAEDRAKLVAACHTLSGIAGVTYFSVGTRAEDVEEPGVSVSDFDVALQTVFESKEAKEAYLVDPIHKAFVEDNHGLWSQVRVFDSYLTTPPGR
jgi:hypothetical protein